MVSGLTLSSFFASSQSSSSGNSSSGNNNNNNNNNNRREAEEDAALQSALELSEAEARLSRLSEEELLEQAMRASEAEMVRLSGAKRPRSASAGGEEEGEGEERKGKRRADAAAEVASRAEGSAETGLTFTKESFSDKEQVINRFSGSLDLVYCKGWIRKQERQQLRDWMLVEMKWHRVSYTSIRSKQKIITPRFTATFGKDDSGAPDSAYPVKSKPIPTILCQLKDELEEKTGAHFNAIIINFYQDGKDSISYHADDESFLGPLPTIASLSLGSSRDFYLRRKFGEESEPRKEQFYTKGIGPAASRPTEKMRLDDGDLIVMKGKTQAEWEHSIPKRANAAGRINLTFRNVISVKGTNNFQRYNRGLPTDDDTRTYRWNPKTRGMVVGSGGV